MTSRNPRYSQRHPQPAAHEHPPLPPALRTREPLPSARPMPFAIRLDHYDRPQLTPAQNRRIVHKLRRAGTAMARREAAEARRAASIAAQQAERNAVLLGRVTQLPPIRWGKSAAAHLRDGHRG